MLKLFTTSLFVIVFLFVKKGESFNCFVCRSDRDEGCDDKNILYSVECPPKKNVSAVHCRKIAQKLKFKDEDSWTNIRECAYEKGHLECYQYKWLAVAYQETCECDEENCNSGNTHIANILTVILIPALVRILIRFVIENT